MVRGTQGYAEDAEALIRRYESVSVAEKLRPVLHLIPEAPCRVLDIGAGTGADAAFFAARGHRVLAVEPVDQFRLAGMALHPSPLIEWANDNLPDLKTLSGPFEVVTMSAVWMHLDADERRQAMPRVASLVRQEGVLIMSLRHGPVPAGRRMFEVSAHETIELAQAQGLRTVLNVQTESVQLVNRVAGVTWSCLAFVMGKMS